MSKSPTKKNGFTIIEAVVAFVVLIIGIFAVMQIFPFSLKLVGDSQSTTNASIIGLEKIEELISLGYDDISTGTIEAKHRLSDDDTNYLYDFQRQTVVQTVDSNLNPSGSDIGFKKITVTVYWRSTIRSTEKSIEMNSLISKY
jgi:Tfp pilus assembly protein PilV